MKNLKNQKNQVFKKKKTIFLSIIFIEGSEYSSESEEESQDLKRKTKELFRNAFCRKIFLDHFMSYLKQKNYITLYEEKFTQLANIFIDISTGFININ